MKIEQFQDFLDKDLAWRKHELSQLFMILDTVESKEVIGKSIILLLYAHWEGFVKKSSKCYLKYVSERKIKLQELTLNFHAIVLRNHAKACIDLNALNLSNEFAFIQKHNKMLEKQFKVKIDVDNEFDKELIDTQHNLSSKVLKNIIEIVGVTYNDAIKTRSNYIDSNLVKHRNAIGHGNRMQGSDDLLVLEFEHIVQLKDFVVSMLDYYADVLLSYVENEFFLQAKNQERVEYENQQELLLSRKLEEIENRHA